MVVIYSVVARLYDFVADSLRFAARGDVEAAIRARKDRMQLEIGHLKSFRW